ncbi:hypothetical protein Ancab_028949 [Ancistrocladus abbreviatus]
MRRAKERGRRRNRTTSPKDYKCGIKKGAQEFLSSSTSSTELATPVIGFDVEGSSSIGSKKVIGGASLELEKAELSGDKTFGDEQHLGPAPLPLDDKPPQYTRCANPIREQLYFNNQIGASNGDLSSNFESSNGRKEVPQSSKGLSNNGSWASLKGPWASSSMEVVLDSFENIV